MECIFTPGIDPHLGVLYEIFCKLIYPICGRRKRTYAARSVWLLLRMTISSAYPYYVILSNAKR